MEIKFVELSEIEAKRTRARTTRYKFSEFIEELYKHPNQWAEFPQKVNNSTSAYRVQTMFKDIKVLITGGNNLPAGSPGKQEWTVYLCYVKDEETF